MATKKAATKPVAKKKTTPMKGNASKKVAKKLETPKVSKEITAGKSNEGE